MKTPPKDGRLDTCTILYHSHYPPVKPDYNLSKGMGEKDTHGEKVGKKRVATPDNRWKVFNWLSRSEKMDPYMTMEGAKKQSDLHNSKKFSEGFSNWMIINISASMKEGGAKNFKKWLKDDLGSNQQPMVPSLSAVVYL